MTALTLIALFLSCIPASAETNASQARVLKERTEMEGPRESESVHRVLDEHLEHLATCVQAEPRPSSRAGTVSLAFQVDGAGVPRHLAVEGGSLLSAMIRACVEHRAQALDFGTGPETGVRVVLELES